MRLLDIDQCTSQWVFPVVQSNYLWEIKEVNNCALILSNEDEAIDYNVLSIGYKEVRVISINNNYQIKNVKRLMIIMKSILQETTK